MRLHQNKDQFIEVLLLAAEENLLSPAQIEKDYYVSLFLKNLSLQLGDKIVFKGGTSLSKCFNVIQRFSEDIDLALRMDTGDHISTGERRKLKATIYGVIKDSGMSLLNDEDIRSRRDHNIYIAQYESVFPNDVVTPKRIVVETMLSYPPYPFKKMNIHNYVSSFLASNDTLVNKFALKPFEMLVQTLERTFIDKIFALCDYHLRQNYYRHSRHIYDVHMLWTKGNLDLDIIREILESVVAVRQARDDINVSSTPGTNIKKIMEDISNKNSYKEDFLNTTIHFIHHGTISYEICMKSYIEIIHSDIFPTEINNYKKTTDLLK